MPQITLAPGNYYVWAEFTTGSPQFANSMSLKPAMPNLMVTQEDARASYTGDMLVFTTTSTAVTLRATVQDITALPTDPAYDANAGDIRNARVDLTVNNTAMAGCAGLTPTLIGTDPKTGTVTCTVPLSSGTASTEYTIGVAVSNYYRDLSEGEIGVVEVAQPNGSFITGGGYLVESNSAGTLASPPGARTNLGFNVRYNKSGTNPQGHVNVIFRTAGRVYQIQSSSITSFGTALQTAASYGTASPVSCTGPPSLSCYGLGDFKSKANLTDVTNPLNPIAILPNGGGPMMLQISIVDKGEPGSSDQLAITLWNGDGTTLVFSSNWNPPKTMFQTLSGGNMVVH
jgi:hypothetical protein